MKLKAKHLSLFFMCVFMIGYLPAQNHAIDSLRSLIKTQMDTSKVNSLNKLSKELEKVGNYDSAFFYAESANTLAEKDDYKKGIAIALGNMGNFYFNTGNYLKDLDCQNKSLEISQQIGYKRGIAAALTYIGMAYYALGDYPKVLECDFKALTIGQEIEDNTIMAANYCNLGNLFDSQKDFHRAIEYYNNALTIDEKKGDKTGMAVDLGNIGGTYNNLGDSSKALEYMLRALSMTIALGDKDGVSSNYQSIASIYARHKNYPKALEYDFKALAIAREIGDKNNMSLDLANIGDIYTAQKSYTLAREYLDSSFTIAKNIGEKEDIKGIYFLFSVLDSCTGNYKATYDDYKAYIIYRDSLINDANSKKTMQSQMNFEFNRKTDSAKAIQDNLNVIAEKKSQHQKLLLNSFIGGFALMLALALVIFIGYKQKQKANIIISHQKELVEGKNNEILDSITYAKRLQEAILPPIALIKKFFPESFVFYKPKDIVAGDFYWMERAGDTIHIAAADCTGHGVPGALVSVICSNALNRTVKEFHITEPGKILDKVTELVLETFEKSESEVQDGMDISLCCINTKTNEVQWSGAYNPLWYIQHGELHEVEADKQPIGKYDNPHPFKTHHVKLQKGDVLYLFTDGYADQFGGPKGKKFKYRQLIDKLKEINGNSMADQQKMLNQEFEMWKGDLDQVDDILILGVRL